MRAWWLALLLTACSGNSLPTSSDGGGGAADLSHGSRDLASTTRVDLAGIDLAGPPPGETCVSACNRCENGPCCGSLCCNAGEWCDASNTCRCGSGPSCTGTLFCATGGPIRQGGNQCGGTCCGDSTHPCPL